MMILKIIHCIDAMKEQHKTYQAVYIEMAYLLTNYPFDVFELMNVINTISIWTILIFLHLFDMRCTLKSPDVDTRDC